MPELSTYIGVEPRTASNQSGATIGRGLRVFLGATGLITLADASKRGDYVTLQDIANNDVGLVVSASGGGKVPAVAAVAVAMGDSAYGTTNGQFTNVVSTNPIMGRFTQPASGAGILTEVELEPVL